MADKAWKAFEREIACLFGGRRFPANQGGDLDVEGPTVIAQCKLVKVLSLNALADEAEQIARRSAGTLKTGVVAVKPRRGSGRRSPILIVMTAEEWTRMHGTPQTESDG